MISQPAKAPKNRGRPAILLPYIVCYAEVRYKDVKGIGNKITNSI